MAANTKSNFIIPELLADAVATGFSGGVEVFMGSPCVVLNPTLPTDKRGGDVVKVPYFGNIGEFEDVAEGAALTPATVTPDSETASVARTGKAIEITGWAEIAAAYADPYQELARQLVEGAKRRFGKAILDAAKASLPAMTNDQSAGVLTLDYDMVVDTQALWGDEVDDVVMMAMHSKPFNDLRKLKDSTGRPLAVENVLADGKTLRSFAGIPVFVSDRLAPASSVYTTLLLKRSALCLWYQPEPSVDTDKDILKNTRLASVNTHFVAYRYKQMPGLTKPGVAIIKHK